MPIINSYMHQWFILVQLFIVKCERAIVVRVELGAASVWCAELNEVSAALFFWAFFIVPPGGAGFWLCCYS